MSITLNSVSKKYQSGYVFRDITHTFHREVCNVVTGPNGSGKSTLLRLLCQLEQPSRGTISYSIPGRSKVVGSAIRPYIGYLSPELNLYAQLNSLENLIFFSKLKRIKPDQQRLRELLLAVGLSKQDQVRALATYSTGMKQRIKLAYALLGQPQMLVLDEPTANLDLEGKQMIIEIINKFKNGRTVVLATNEPEEVRVYGENVCRLSSGCLDSGS